MRINPKLLAVHKHLQREYQLQYSEAEMLSEDLIVNLEQLHADIRGATEAGDWTKARDAVRAVHGFGTNLGLDKLSGLGAELREGIDAKDSAVADLLSCLDDLIKELTERAT